ncbi:MAG: AMP-binding protein, partial [Psychrosphaera sp.]|nr:AMP-binding protein [Psychrosphaera sp.]
MLTALQTNLPNSRIYNMYGPTETTVWSSMALLEDDNIHLGRPINNTQFYLLDDNQQLVPNGTAGELYIGGEGIARGYLNRPDLTAERFIDNPFYDPSKTGSSKLIYRTGDLVRYLPSSGSLPDGNLGFIGRADDQVKIRGFRIELGEVESQLEALDGVDSAFVVAVTLSGSQQLAGYIKPVEPLNDTNRAEVIRGMVDTLKARLPNYMVPGFVMAVDQWPLTPNGKIDKKALPKPDATALQVEYVTPSSDAEQKLAGIWARLLDIDASAISATVDFFDLGGHSLLCIRLVGDIRTVFEVEVSVQSIFDHSTLQLLANVIEQSSQSAARPPLVAVDRADNKVAVSFAQQRLWFIDSLQGGSPEYNMPVAFEVAGQMDMALLNAIFNTIIERHEVLRTVYFEQD